LPNYTCASVDDDRQVTCATRSSGPRSRIFCA